MKKIQRAVEKKLTQICCDITLICWTPIKDNVVNLEYLVNNRQTIVIQAKLSKGIFFIRDMGFWKELTKRNLQELIDGQQDDKATLEHDLDHLGEVLSVKIESTEPVLYYKIKIRHEDRRLRNYMVIFNKKTGIFELITKNSYNMTLTIPIIFIKSLTPLRLSVGPLLLNSLDE